MLIGESRINSTPLCADHVSCQEEIFATIFCGRADCENLPTRALRELFRRALYVEKLRIARRKPLSRNNNST
jgi:hypothetical protein